MRVKSLNHTQRRFLRAHYLVLRTSQDTAAGHFGLEACTEALYCEFNINQSTAYVWCLLGFLAAVLSSTDLNCYVWGNIKNMQNYCWYVSVTWHHRRTYRGHEQGPLELVFIAYWSVLSLWYGLLGATGSLIKLTLGVTHGAEAAAPQHWGATMNTFPSFSPLS